MSGWWLIPAFAVGTPIVVGALVLICVATISAGEAIAHSLGLTGDGALLVGALAWFSTGGAVLGAIIWSCEALS